ncbi:IS110 family transposase [Phenylobacterium sp. J426]|uniref:IS110 family transposase n=1 Tax=Phenylobacterium sp. J426 TaxID=2898439 RepID=UPI002150D83D|nr:IS110 family transposase [Phenylobacterium sp. J426]MCR5873642.1 IS110 family transposase [Phenylobacterium sp. J426]
MQQQSYVGLDVSLAETAVCVVDGTGKKLFEAKVPTDAAMIAGAIRKHAVGQLERVGMETGTTAPWLWRELQAHGLPVVCLDTRHAHRALSLRVQKTDRNDARGLAELVRLGWYREARVRSMDAQFMRALLLSRRQLMQVVRNVSNQLRGTLKVFGLARTSTAGKGFRAKVQALAAEHEWARPVLDPLLAVLVATEEQLKAITTKLVRLARDDNDVRRMMTVPGIGPISALAFKAAIDDPKRFTKSQAVGPYLGLVPRVYQSGESEWTGRISKTGDELARTYLYEAAGVLLHQVPSWCALKAWGVRLARKNGLKRARVAVRPQTRGAAPRDLGRRHTIRMAIGAARDRGGLI